MSVFLEGDTTNDKDKGDRRQWSQKRNLMARELNVINRNDGSGDACTYMWACAICDELDRKSVV